MEASSAHLLAPGLPEPRLAPAPAPASPVLRPERSVVESIGSQELRLRERIYRRTLAAADVIAAAFALVGAVSVLGPDTLSPLAALVPPAVVLGSKVHGLYDRDELLIRKSTIDETPKLFQLATLYVLLFWLASPALMTGPLGRDQALGLWAMFLFASLGGRWVARRVAGRATTVERCLFVGDARAYDAVRAKLEMHLPRTRLVARVSLARPTRRGGTRAGAYAERELRDLIAEVEAHRVIIVPQHLGDEDTLDLVRAAKGSGVRVSLLPHVHEVVGSSVVFDDLFGMTLLGVQSFSLSRSSKALKRGFDLAGSLAGLLAVSPLLAVIALAIKLDSRGPVFFRQTRIGRDGRPFRIFKFRTMVAGAEARRGELEARNEARGLFKIADDPRVTRVGRLLRRTSLDELPQLLNVARGEMSLVGPRPLVADEDERITGWARQRLDLTPGMTGHWQILGSARVPMAEMMKIDHLYVACWSLWSDVKILVRTVPYMLGMRGQ